MSSKGEVEFEIKTYLSEGLATRSGASHFFEILESSSAGVIIVDFAHVESIARSFADEYMRRKKAPKLAIKERNVPNNIQKMFDIVSAPADKKMVVDIPQLKIGIL